MQLKVILYSFKKIVVRHLIAVFGLFTIFSNISEASSCFDYFKGNTTSSYEVSVSDILKHHLKLLKKDPITKQILDRAHQARVVYFWNPQGGDLKLSSERAVMRVLALNMVMNQYVKRGLIPNGVRPFDYIFSDFSDLPSNQIQVILNPAKSRYYTVEDFPYMPAKIKKLIGRGFWGPDVTSHMKVVLKKSQGQSWRLPIEKSLGVDILSRPEFSKYSQIIEMSRNAISTNDPVDSALHYSTMFNFILAKISKKELDTTLIVSSTLRSGLSKLYQQTWGFETLDRLDSVQGLRGEVYSVSAITARQLLDRIQRVQKELLPRLAVRQKERALKLKAAEKSYLSQLLAGQEVLSWYLGESGVPGYLKIIYGKNSVLESKIMFNDGRVLDGVVTEARATLFGAGSDNWAGLVHLNIKMSFLDPNFKSVQIHTVVPLLKGLWLVMGEGKTVNAQTHTNYDLTIYRGQVQANHATPQFQDNLIYAYNRGRDHHKFTWAFNGEEIVSDFFLSSLGYRENTELVDGYEMVLKSIKNVDNAVIINGRHLDTNFLQSYEAYQRYKQTHSGLPDTLYPIDINLDLFRPLSLNPHFVIGDKTIFDAHPDGSHVELATDILPLWEAFHRSRNWRDVFNALGFKTATVSELFAN